MNFKRVTKQNPCPICRAAGLRGIDWCRVFADGWAECMRVQSDRPAKSGGWMHWQGQLSPVVRPVAVARREPPTINATRLMREWVAATPAIALAEFAASLGVTTPSLVAVGAAWAAPHSAWAFPMCDGYGNIVGIRLRNQQGKFAVRGSKQGIFLGNWNECQLQVESNATCGLTAPAGIQRVEHSQTVAIQANPSPQPTDSGGLATGRNSSCPTLFVCEGPTDTAAAVDLGLFAVGRPNCCCGGPEIRIYARQHGCNRVVIIADNDKPGLDGAKKVGGELKLPFAIYVPPAKDLRKFVQLGGTRVMIENTLKGTVWNP